MTTLPLSYLHRLPPEEFLEVINRARLLKLRMRLYWIGEAIGKAE
jgi:hypothetical protein